MPSATVVYLFGQMYNSAHIELSLRSVHEWCVQDLLEAGTL